MKKIVSVILTSLIMLNCMGCNAATSTAFQSSTSSVQQENTDDKSNQASEKEDEQKVAEEKAKEAEEQKQQEEQAKKLEEQTKKEEEQRIVQEAENARINTEKEEQEKIQQQQIVQANNSANQTVQNNPENGEMVWLSATGECYHSINNCGRMNPNKATKVTREQAIQRGYKACSKCW